MLIFQGIRPLGCVKNGWSGKNELFSSSIFRKWQEEIRPKLLLMTNRKLHISFRLTPRSITLDDLELLQGQILSEFRRISQIWELTTAKRIEDRPVLSATEL